MTELKNMNIANLPVMKAKCKTCPFHTDEHGRHLDEVFHVGKGASPITSSTRLVPQINKTRAGSFSRGQMRDPHLVSRIQIDIISKASQLCHHPKLIGEKETHICRGARDFQIEIFHRLGVLEAPTQEAWDKALNTIEGNR